MRPWGPPEQNLFPLLSEPTEVDDARLRTVLKPCTEWPAVVFPDGSLMQKPANDELAVKLKLQTAGTQDYSDVIIVRMETKPVGEGTGLGLDIVHRIVMKHKGGIQMASAPGRTAFQVRLPL